MMHRMTPAVWILIPLTVALTAQISTAPAAVRRRLTENQFSTSVTREKNDVHIDDQFPILENTKTTTATTRIRNRNFDTTESADGED
jgi:hypothetical protein